jgi:hypothetical protein
VVFHVAAGVTLVVLSALVLSKVGFPRSWPVGLIALGGLLLAASGIALLFTGATRPNQWLVNWHAAAGVAVAVVAGVMVAARLVALPALVSRSVLLTALGVAALAGTMAATIAWRAPQTRAARYQIENPIDPPLSMAEEGGGQKSPFFPSSAQTDV